MNEAFKERIVGRVMAGDAPAVLAAIQAEYEFDCPAFIYAGPGHQSRHDCEYHRPHPVTGEHSDSMYNWEGTAIRDGNRLVFNPRYYGG